MTAGTERGEAAQPSSAQLTGNPVAASRIGRVVAGTYRVARHIGSGGSSDVYEVEHQRLGKRFAMKLLRTDGRDVERAQQRFRHEAKAIARLQSEHIVSVVDCGVLEDETPYLVMELLRGEDLRSLLKREGALPLRRAVQIVIDACRALVEVHDAGLIHRDLKPENLFIARRSTGEDWCKVLDFGLAKMDASLSTAHGAIIGTVRYMAPEQLSDGASVVPATDIYALGAILYECLTGKLMIEGSSPQEVMYRVMTAEPAVLTETTLGVPAALSALVSRCVAKDSEARPQSAAELAELLKASTYGVPVASHAPQDTLSERSASELRSGSLLTRSPASGRPILLLGALVLALFAGTSGWLLRAAAHAAESTRASAAALPSPAARGQHEPPQPSASSTASAARESPPALPQASTAPIRAVAPAPRTGAKSRRATADALFDDANPY